MQITDVLPNPTIHHVFRIYLAVREDHMKRKKPWTQRADAYEAALLRRIERERNYDSTAYHAPASSSLLCLAGRMIDVLSA
jgi:hypothetical protein